MLLAMDAFMNEYRYKVHGVHETLFMLNWFDVKANVKSQERKIS